MQKLISFLIFLLISLNAYGRGGGGCLEQGTLIATPRGSVAIETIKVGDRVYSRDQDKQQSATVLAVTQVTPDHYIEIQLPASILHVTGEHLIATANGLFRRAANLTAKDAIMVWQKNHWQRVPILGLRQITANRPAYNLLVDHGASYVANQALVHNKGCFLPETPILRADGTSIAISQVKPGDSVEAYEPDGKFIAATVRAVLRHEVDTYYRITTEKVVLNVTGEHPFYIGQGTFKTVESLRVGDVIYAYANKQLSKQHLLNIQQVHAKTTVYNLQTDEPHTYFAAGIAVHNKGGGCFPAGTQIKIPGGFKSIELLAPGDAIISINRNGGELVSKVKSTYATRSPILTLITNQGILHTTAEHPIAISPGKFTRADALSVNTTISYYFKGLLTAATLLDVQRNSEDMVFNIETGSPHTFIADNVLVHNKGGGGGHGGGSVGASCPKGDTLCQITNVLGISIFVMFLLGIRHILKYDYNLDYLNSRTNIERKSLKTVKLLDFLAKQDATMQPTLLEGRTREVFTRLQQCWMDRNYAPMKDLLIPDLYKQHLKQIEGMIRNHEINKLDRLFIKNIDLVNVRYTEKKSQREFTALITANVADYYIDDRNQKILRGSTTSAPFQEFWTFELEPDGWRLRDIEQARESDYLKQENFVEMFTDLQIKKIYGHDVDNLGTSGALLPKAVAQKEDKVTRMLNFLYRSDKMWDREIMAARARFIFTAVHMSLEAGELDSETQAALFPAVAKKLKEIINLWNTAGKTIQYRNFCIRKIEIVLVNSYNDKMKNEFTARISAHAEIIYLKNDSIVSRDNDVTPFVEFWEFGRLDDVWKLKDIKTQSGADIINTENTEEGSLPSLLQWYYTKKRAI